MVYLRKRKKYIWEDLYKKDKSVLNSQNMLPFIKSGGVEVSIFIDKCNIYKCMCIDTECTLGTCTESNIIADMITNIESKIVKLVCVIIDVSVRFCCDRIFDVISKNLEILVNHPNIKTIKLNQLVPNWRSYDKF